MLTIKFFETGEDYLGFRAKGLGSMSTPRRNLWSKHLPTCHRRKGKFLACKHQPDHKDEVSM